VDGKIDSAALACHFLIMMSAGIGASMSSQAEVLLNKRASRWSEDRLRISCIISSRLQTGMAPGARVASVQMTQQRTIESFRLATSAVRSSGTAHHRLAHPTADRQTCAKHSKPELPKKPRDRRGYSVGADPRTSGRSIRSAESRRVSPVSAKEGRVSNAYLGQ
jgi:hypothetical protein